MKLTFDTALSLLIASSGMTSPITILAAQRGDGELAELELVHEGTPHTRTGLEEYRLVAKPITAAGWDAPAYVLARDWTYNTTTGRIEGDINYNVDLLNALLLLGEADEKTSVDLQAQFAWRVNNTSTWRRSQTIILRLNNNIWRGTETDPDAGDPEETIGAPTGIPYAVTAPADVVNDNATANTLEDIDGLSFPVQSGSTYHFRALIPYNAAATTTGARFTVTGPTTSFLTTESVYPLTSTTETKNRGLTAYSLPASCNATSMTTGNLAILEGILTPTADGTVKLQFASEVSASAITVKAGALVHVTRLL